MNRKSFWLICFLVPFLCPSPAYSSSAPFRYASTSHPPLEKLSEGFIEGARVKAGGNQLSMVVETFFIVPQSPSQTMEQIKTPDRDSTGESSASFGIDSRGGISLPPRASDFHRFEVSSKKSRFGFGGSPMMELKADDLNLSSGELKKLKTAAKKGPKSLKSAWVNLFLERTRTFQSGGIVEAPRYQTGPSDFHHQAELVTLLKSTPKVLKEFQPLIGSLMTGKLQSGGEGPVFTWESSKIQGDQTVSLLCLVGSGTREGGFQAVEVSYYVTGKYYTSLIFYDLHPVQIEGRNQTLVWRGDYVITSSIGFLKGIERVAAENIMLQEIKNSIRSFIDSAKSNS